MFGEFIWVFGLEEGLYYVFFNIVILVVVEGDGFILNGSKIFVFDGYVVDKLIVVVWIFGVIDDKNGLSFFVFDVEVFGLECICMVMVDGCNVVNFEFFNVRLIVLDCFG